MTMDAEARREVERIVERAQHKVRFRDLCNYLQEKREREFKETPYTVGVLV